MPDYRYLFGPVPSRRFGRSLGVDLTPLKTCSFNCLFCQLGPTRHSTLERQGFGLHLNEVAKYTGHLVSAGRIQVLPRGDEIYYEASRVDASGQN